jgi:hypothetical protein
VAEFCKQFPVIFEIDPKHDRDAEDGLPMWQRIKDLARHILPELNRFSGMTTGVKLAILTREDWDNAISMSSILNRSCDESRKAEAERLLSLIMP